MHCLVPPDRTLWHISSPGDLKAYIDAKKLDPKLAGNLRQLLGYDPVGADRRCRHEAGKHFLLANASWMYDVGGSRVVPLFGSTPKKLDEFKLRCAPTMMVSRTFQRMLDDGKPRDGWRCGPPPLAVHLVPDGGFIDISTPVPDLRTARCVTTAPPVPVVHVPDATVAAHGEPVSVAEAAEWTGITVDAF